MSLKSSLFFLIAITLASSSIFSMELNQNSAKLLRIRLIKKQKNNQLIAQHSHPRARLKLRKAIALQQVREEERTKLVNEKRKIKVNTPEKTSSSNLDRQKQILYAAHKNAPGKLNQPKPLKKLTRIAPFENLADAINRPTTPALPEPKQN